MAILNKKDLACYIINKYQNEYNKEISPIKLQKSLYFLFAMWGGNVANAKFESKEDTEDDEKYEAYDTYLFDACFEAWRYGPVDKEVYKWFKNNELDCDTNVDIFSDSKISYIEDVKQYINELLEKIFKISDFGLVDITHSDDCWKNAIKTENKIISNEDIIKDYIVK